MKLHHQPRDLTEGRQAASRNHGGGNDAAHGKRRILHLIHADDDHRYGDQLLQGLNEVHRARRNELDLAAHIGDVLGGALPQTLHAALGVERLDGLQVGQRLHEQRVALR